MASGRSRVVPFERPFAQRQLSSWDDPWSDMMSPSRIMDQNFGMSLARDDFPPWSARSSYYRPRSSDDEFFRGWLRRLEDEFATRGDRSRMFDDDFFKGMMMRQKSMPAQSGTSEVTNSADEFKVNLDVVHFKPEEINVKTVDDRITITAKHEEKQDEHGFIMREFKRSYLLPTDVDPMSIKSTLSADGILSISAPKKCLPGVQQEHVIPIEHSSSATSTSAVKNS